MMNENGFVGRMESICVKGIWYWHWK